MLILELNCDLKLLLASGVEILPNNERHYARWKSVIQQFLNKFQTTAAVYKTFRQIKIRM